MPSPRSFLRRYAVFMTAVTAVAAIAGLLIAHAQRPTYTAKASVLVEVLLRPGDAARSPDMGTEKAIASSEVVARRAASQLQRTVSSVHSAEGVSVPVDANILTFSFSDHDRNVARDGANAVATAYLTYRNAVATADSAARAPAAAVPEPPALSAQLVTPATTPGSPSSPDVLVNVLAGLVAGLLLALGLALLIDRTGVRLRTARRWVEVTGVAALLQSRPLPSRRGFRRRARAGATVSPAGLDQLRVRVARWLTPTGGVVVVTSVRPQLECDAIASGLVGSFRNAGCSSRLVDPTHDAVGSRRVRRSEVAVIVTPSVSDGVTAVEFAEHADAVVLIDDLGRARRGNTLAAINELHDARARLCGAVLVGRSWQLDRRMPRGSDPSGQGHPTAQGNPAEAVQHPAANGHRTAGSATAAGGRSGPARRTDAGGAA